MAMCEMYPATWQEFIEEKYFRDHKEIYTNGAEIMLVSDVKKMMQHYLQERPNNDEIILQLEAEIDSSDKYIREYDGGQLQIGYNKGLSDALKIVKQMSQERPKGRWVRRTKYYGDCSECGEISSVKSNFCPNCGADMRNNEE